MISYPGQHPTRLISLQLFLVGSFPIAQRTRNAVTLPVLPQAAHCRYGGDARRTRTRIRAWCNLSNSP